MLIKINKCWELSDSVVTPESCCQRRRSFLKTAGVGLAALAVSPRNLIGATQGFPSLLNPRYTLRGHKPTAYNLITRFNNFYEFSTDKKEVASLANQGWKTEPWTLEIGGMVDKPIKIDVNDLIKKIGGIEQRNYRFRCVEAWSMIVPWDGFPMRKLIELVGPKSDARFVEFTTFFDPEVAPGQRGGAFAEGPYVEALTIEEAAHFLTFLATGIYGKPIPHQNGAPIRLVAPWKYGFKNIKSIVKIEFKKERPINTWQALGPREYGFYGNVNPNVSHPRWSQATERVLGRGLFDPRQDTLMFNGYEREVSLLYKGLDLRKNF